MMDVALRSPMMDGLGAFAGLLLVFETVDGCLSRDPSSSFA